MSDPLKPSPALLATLGSIIAHVEEGSSDDGHHFDMIAARTLLSNADVQEWMAEMRKMSMLPLRRKP